MKVTGKMTDDFQAGSGYGGDIAEPAVRAGLEAVLRGVPDVVPFAFPGGPDTPVFLHPSCGTVAIADKDGTIVVGVPFGECDCENTSPWLRIYVERPESA